jgi:RHS repeat-associated protein
MPGGVQDGGAPDCGPSETAVLQTNDGSGYKFSLPDQTLYTPAGAVTVLPDIGVPGHTYTDRNGNQITQSSGVFTDTLGQTALTVSGSGTPSSPNVFSYTAPSGATASFTMSFVAYTVKTNFGCSGIAEYGPTANNLVDRITLPDGSYYQFTYEPTPGYSGDVTGRLASVRLPTGGTIAYSYSGGNNGIICSDGSTATLTRTTPDGTWTYARTLVSGTQWQTLVTDPQNNQTVIQFQLVSNPSNNQTLIGSYETQRQVYQGSTGGTLLRTINTCYNGAGSPCTGTAITLPITQRTIIDQYGSSGLQCKHNYLYNSVGGLTEQDDYDYGSGAPGALLRQILVTYASLGNITAFRQQVTVKNGSGTVVSQTNYNYDETTPTATSGIAQHTSVSGSRGNLTSINYPVSGLTSHLTYYDTGSPNTSQDVNGATTTYNYSSNTADCQMAFPTSVSEPLSMSKSFAWNCTGGVMTSLTDENNQVTSTTYSDAYFWRPANVNFPDGGQTSWTYNSSTSLTTTTKMNSSQNITSTVLLDGLGRTSQTQLNSDPQGVDYSVMTYDALGRPYQAYNPTRCSPPTTNCGESTWGYTTSLYDALGRPTQITLQDGSLATASYSNNAVTATDPAGKKRQSTIDSLGRLTQVLEDPSGVNYETDYGYDALGNLLCVGQKGTNTGTFSGCSSIPAGWQARTYAWDAMSRLTSETNPESGTVTYRYDASGHTGDLTSRVAPAPNQTGSGTVTTTYGYDLLHRLTSKSYSDGTTPSATYAYDVSTIDGDNSSNPVGRLVKAATGGTYPAALYYGYDSNGREAQHGQCAYFNGCGTTNPTLWIVSNTYDLASDLTSYTDAFGHTLKQTFDSAGRPWQLTSSWVDSTHPQNLYTVGTTSQPNYNPPGGVNTALLGNGLTAAYAYNNRVQPCRMDWNTSAQSLANCTSGTPGTSVLDFTYGYNAGVSNNGNIASWSSTGQQNFSRAHTYDSLNRLSTMSDSNTSQSCRGLLWNYDPWGNFTDQTVTAGTCYTFHQTVNAQNHLIGPPFQYDAAGNMTYDGNLTYFYDAEGRLVQINGTFGNCSTASLCNIYHATGRRAELIEGGNYLAYIHDLAGNVISEWNSCCGLNRSYAYLNGQRIAEYGDGTTYFHHKDHLGSTRLMTDINRSFHDNIDYVPFGQRITGGTGTSYEFADYEYDNESGHDTTWFRQYAWQLGRWMTPDPAGLAAVDPSNPQSWNRYAYVLNNPMVYVDPLGLCGGGGQAHPPTPCADPDNPYPSAGGGAGGCSLDGCGNGLGDPGCYLNGSPVGCNLLGPLLSSPSGVTAPCPSGASANCPSLQIGADGNWQIFLQQQDANPNCDDPSATVCVGVVGQWFTFVGGSGNSSEVHGWAYYFFTTNPFPTAWQSLKSESGCGHLIAETFLKDLSPVPVEASPSLGDAIPFAGKATAAAGLARASAYSLSRGLVQPLKSTTYRALRGSAIVASDAVEEAALPATIVYAGADALVKSISSAAQGECH